MGDGGAHGAAEAAGHAAEAAHDDGHGDGHDGPALGGIDWAMWGVGVLGTAVALVIVVIMALATGFVPGA